MAPAGTVLDGIDLVLQGPAAHATVTAPIPSPALAPPAAETALTLLTVVPPPAPPVLAAGPSYAVHLSSYRTRDKASADAVVLAARLMKLGVPGTVPLEVPTRVRRADLGAKGVWFRVLAGDLPTREAALAYRASLVLAGIVEVGPVYVVTPEL